MFSFLAGFSAFGYGIYCFYQAVKFNRLFRTGIRAKATVVDIVVELKSSPQGLDEKYLYYLVLELPPFQGNPLGKQYEQDVHPKRYKIGDVVDIIQQKDYPTEIVMVKELPVISNPIELCVIGILLWVIAYII
ncbi:MAG: hypothetical protein JNN28_08025 [Saprospiraceae bacterium]|nr:hypothetical protein [Saprospiraceae bacterium]